VFSINTIAMIPELEIKKLRAEIRQEFKDLRAMLSGRAVLGNWVKQEAACDMLEIKPRQLRNLRIRLDVNGKKVGCIRWRQGRGKTKEYHKADIESYLNGVMFA
jgi:hypothetical protein